MQQAKGPAERIVWIDLLKARQAHGVVPALLAEATGADAAVRGHAMTALAELAGAKDIPGMVAAVLKAEKGVQRDSAEKCVMLVCQRIAEPGHQADLVIDCLRSAPPADQAALLPTLGRIGGPKALERIQAALASKDRQQYELGLRGLCNWPDASVADELLKLAQAAPQAQHRLLALRAFVRVVSLPGKGTDDAAKLARLRQAMELCSRKEERVLVIDRVAAVRSVEALRFVLPYLDQPELCEAACKTVVALAHRRELRQPNQKEFTAALEKVLRTSKEAGVIEQAKRGLGRP